MIVTPRVHSLAASGLCVVDGADHIYRRNGLPLARLFSTSCRLGRFVGVRDDGILALVHREQSFFVDGTLGLSSQLGMRKSQFGEGDGWASYVGIRNRLVALARRQHVE